MFSREQSEFVFIDKEAVVGYENQKEKDYYFNKIQGKYKELQKEISTKDPVRYGSELQKKSIGNELDFLALDKHGSILLIEFKHGTNTSGIYLSPLQIGMYYDLFNQLPINEFKKSVSEMLVQKQKIGLISDKWLVPEIRNIIPVLIISEYKNRGSGKEKYHEILAIARARFGADFLKNIETYNYTSNNGLSSW